MLLRSDCQQEFAVDFRDIGFVTIPGCNAMMNSLLILSLTVKISLDKTTFNPLFFRFLLIVIVLLLTTPILADDQKTIAVRCAEVAFSQTVESGDHDAFARWVDEDARFIGGKVNRGRAAVAEAWSGFFKEGADKIVWRPEYTEVLSSGDLAFSRGPYRLRWIDDKGDAQESWGYFNSTWRLNEDGQWRVLFDAGGAAANPPSDETKALIEAPFEECNSDS